VQDAVLYSYHPIDYSETVKRVSKRESKKNVQIKKPSAGYDRRLDIDFHSHGFYTVGFLFILVFSFIRYIKIR